MFYMNRIVEYILLSIAVIAAGVGCYFWYSYEKNQASDLQTLSMSAYAKNMLGMYAQQYAAYPGGSDDYLQRSGIAFPYFPRLKDGSDCSEDRCPSYAFTFILSTNAFMPRGEHTVTPDGVQ